MDSLAVPPSPHFTFLPIYLLSSGCQLSVQGHRVLDDSPPWSSTSWNTGGLQIGGFISDEYPEINLLQAR